MKLKKSLAAACFLAVFLVAPAALAQGLPSGDLTGGVTDGVTDKIGGVTDTVDGTTGGVTDTVDGVTDGVTDTVDETTGGGTGGVTDTVDDTVDGVTDNVDETTGGAIDNVEETTGGVTNTVGNVTGGGSNNNNSGSGGHNAHHVGSLSNGGSSLLDGLLGNTNVVPPSLADIPANLIDDLVDKAASKGLTPAAAEGWIEGKKMMDANAYSTPLSSVLSLTTLFENTALDFAQTTQVGGSRAQADGASDGSFFANAGQMAIEAAKTIAFPLALALLAVGFLMAQGRFGRKDPKLVLAPIDTRDESLTFE
jgi:hypothetical protein